MSMFGGIPVEKNRAASGSMFGGIPVNDAPKAQSKKEGGTLENIGEGIVRGNKQRALGISQRILDALPMGDDFNFFGMSDLSLGDLRGAGSDLAQRYAQEGQGTGASGFVGEVLGDPLTYLPLPGAQGWKALAAQGAKIGGLSGATSPTSGESRIDRAENMLANTLFGAGAGGVGTAGINAVTSGIGKGVNALLPKTSREVIDSMFEQGMPVTVGQAYGGHAIPATEGMLAQFPVSGAILRNKRGKMSDEIARILGDTGDSIYANPATQETLGGKVREAITDTVGGLREKIGDFYDDMASKVPDKVTSGFKSVGSFAKGDDLIPYTAVEPIIEQGFIPKGANKYVTDMLEQYADNPAAMKLIGADDLIKLKSLTENPLTAQGAKNIRKFVYDLSQKAKGERQTEIGGVISKFNNILNKDIQESVGKYVSGGAQKMQDADKKAAAAYKVIDRVSSLIQTKTGKPLNISDAQLVTNVLKMANDPTVKGSKGANVAMLRQLDRRLPPEAMQELSSFYLHQMATEPAKFGKNWRSLGDAAKHILFGKHLAPEQMGALNKISDFTSTLRGTLNPSGSAANVAEISGMGKVVEVLAAGAAGAGVASGEVDWKTASVPFLLATALSSKNAAKLINKLPRHINTPQKVALAKDVMTKIMSIQVPQQAAIESNSSDNKDISLSLMGNAKADDLTPSQRKVKNTFMDQIDTRKTPPRTKMPQENPEDHKLLGESIQNEVRPNTDLGSFKKVTTQKDYDALAPNTAFVGKDGTLRLKPGMKPESSSGVPKSFNQAEGFRDKVYRDTTGHRTTGFGYNMDSGIAQKVWDAAGIKKDFNAVRNGKQKITEIEAQKLLQKSYEIARNDAKSLVSNFDDLSKNRKEAIVHLSYQFGLPKLKENLPGVLASINQGNYHAAAARLLASDYGKKYRDRSVKLARMLANNSEYGA